MAIERAFIYSFFIERATQVGSEDGTPLFDDATIEVKGFFDENEAGAMFYDSDRKPLIPSQDRRAVFMCSADADIDDDDHGEVIVYLEGGTARGLGRWEVEMTRQAPGKNGVHHLQCILRGIKESA